MKKAIFVVGLLVLVSCNSTPCSTQDSIQSSKQISDKEVNQIAVLYINENKENCEKSIVPWTDDTILKEHPYLVMLIDSLYQFEQSGSLKKDLCTMSVIRKRFCEFYDSIGLWRRIDNDYAKVDSVLAYAENLYFNYYGGSAGDAINYGMLYRTNRLRHYGLAQKLVDMKDGSLLEKEWSAWIELEKCFQTLTSDITHWDKSNAGGWGISMGINIQKNDIMDAHSALYKRDLQYNGNNGLTAVGVYQKQAKQFLVSCCQAAYKEVLSKEEVRKYGVKYGVNTEVRKCISELPAKIDKWLEARNKWTDAIACDGLRQYYRQSTAQMLVDWAGIVSRTTI